MLLLTKYVAYHFYKYLNLFKQTYLPSKKMLLYEP